MNNERITINTADNGYIVEYYSYEDDEHGDLHRYLVEQKEAFSEPEARVAELEAIQTLFYELMHMLGVTNSKHKPYNLSITITETEN